MHIFRVHILDRIFGDKNFRNMITWKRADAHSDAKIQFPVVSDYILFYAKDFNTSQCFNPQYGPHSEKLLKEWYLYLDLSDSTSEKMSKEEKKFNKT